MTPVFFSTFLRPRTRHASGDRTRRSLASLALCLALAACSSDKGANESNPLTSGIVREGSTTSTALNEFLNTPGDNWGWAGGQFDNPKDEALLPPDPAATFAWHADPTTPPDPKDVLSPSKQNGQAFMLLFSTGKEPKLLQVFTSLTSYTPDAAAWGKLVANGDPISLNVTSATFENDLLTADGGPHIGQTILITITK